MKYSRFFVVFLPLIVLLSVSSWAQETHNTGGNSDVTAEEESEWFRFVEWIEGLIECIEWGPVYQSGPSDMYLPIFKNRKTGILDQQDYISTRLINKRTVVENKLSKYCECDSSDYLLGDEDILKIYHLFMANKLTQKAISNFCPTP